MTKSKALSGRQRIGMIRFGSRVNCEIPAVDDLNVKVGEHVTAGLTVIARKRKSGDDGEDCNEDNDAET